MSSRRKSKAAVAAPMPASPTMRRRRATMMAVGIGLILGAMIGAVGGGVLYFRSHQTIDLGTFSTTSSRQDAGDKQLFGTYAGSAACRDCHVKEFESWSKSHHGLAERSPDAGLDRGAFDPAREFSHGTQKSQVRAVGDKFEVVTPGYEGAATAYPVVRVIGVDPLRQFLTPAPGGRLQTLEASYDPNKDQWFNVYGNEDRHFGEWGHWTGRGVDWNSICASCHNTRVRKNYDEQSDSYQTAMAQLTVSCESCHGPMRQHAEMMKWTSPTTSRSR